MSKRDTVRAASGDRISTLDKLGPIVFEGY